VFRAENTVHINHFPEGSRIELVLVLTESCTGNFPSSQGIQVLSINLTFWNIARPSEMLGAESSR
jgi:hypothetical protein